MKKLILALISFPLMAVAEKPAILMVLTNHAKLGDTGKPTGFYLSEAAHPYEVFTANGHTVTLASPKGGFAPLDPKSLELDDEANAAFWKKFGNADDTKPGIEKTTALEGLRAEDFGAIFFVGGHGTVWDFPGSEEIRRLTAGIYENQGVVGAVCHGPAALVNVKLSDGNHLLAGKKTAVFTNSEEEAVGLSETVPFLLQTAFEKAGAKVETAADFTENAIRDGRLVTGQNPASAKKSAELLARAVSESKAP